MTIPVKLQQFINEALTAVRTHPQHDLNLGYRQAIWAMLEPRANTYLARNSLNIKTAGHRRRSCLAILAIRNVLPIWKQEFPNDKMPEHILSEAQKVINRLGSAGAALKGFDDYWEYAEEVASHSKSMAIAVGYGAALALLTAIDDENFSPDEINVHLTDSQEFDCNDASFFAAVAYANGPCWDIVANPKPDSAKRRQFWEWWLTKAVPAAWQSVPCHPFLSEQDFALPPSTSQEASLDMAGVAMLE